MPLGFGGGAMVLPKIPFWHPVPVLTDQDGKQVGPIFGRKTAEDAWDMVILAGQELPGICSVKGLPTLAFDKKKAGGVDGATITVNGYLPGPIEIDCLIWTPEQWDYFQTIRPLIWRIPNKKQKTKDIAVAISHPGLSLWNINSVIVMGVSVPENGSVIGTKVIKIKCVEFVPTEAKSKTKTAHASVVPLTAPLNPPPRNQVGDPPHKTDINPGGPPVTRKGGLG